MLVVNQGQVAVVKDFAGLATEETSGAGFKFGSLVRPGHRGIWDEPLRTGKYAINPRVYAVEIVPTFILILNRADETSSAHGLDKDLSPRGYGVKPTAIRSDRCPLASRRHAPPGLTPDALK